jgi:hypothetical protein
VERARARNLGARIFPLYTYMVMDALIDDVVAHYRRRGPAVLDEWSGWHLLQGLVLMSPLGKVFMPRKKEVFDKVWARKKEWYDDVKGLREDQIPPLCTVPSACTLVQEN